MATTSDSLVLTTKEAQIILDWDDGQWYVADIDYTPDNGGGGPTTPHTTASSGGVKVPEWDSTYKYTENDIVASSGILYVSKQKQNQGNTPSAGTFWWHPIIDLSAVDAITLEGKNFEEVVKAVLSGSAITDFYKKSEVDNLVLGYFNTVNAKKLDGWSLAGIQNDYKALIEAAKASVSTHTEDYLNSDSATGFDQSLVNQFNSSIMSDSVNQL